MSNKCRECGKPIAEDSYEGQLGYDYHWKCFWKYVGERGAKP